MTEKDLEDICTRLEASLKRSLHVGWYNVLLTFVQSCQITVLQSHSHTYYIAFCLQMAKQEFDNVDGFRNRYSIDLLTHNLLSIVMRRGSFWVMRDNAASHIANVSMDALGEVSAELLIDRSRISGCGQST
jgi:hypothetical protein